jgi:peptide deformylase
VATLEILQVGDPALRVPGVALSREALLAPETQAFIDDLIETMRAANGAGLAATQVGRALRICVIEVKDSPRYPHFPAIPLTVVVNPELRALTEERFDNAEGCLSVPELRGLVPRHAEVEVSAWDRHGVASALQLRGLRAGVYQHEIDHLDGRLFLDRVADPRTLCTRATFERFEKAAYLARMAPFFARMA